MIQHDSRKNSGSHGVCHLRGELVEHGQTGFLCPPPPDDLRAAILAVLGDNRLAAQMGKQAREFAVENFSLDKILKLELDTLSSLSINKKVSYG